MIDVCNQLKDEYIQVWDQLVTADTPGHLGCVGEGVAVAGVVALEPVLTALEAWGIWVHTYGASSSWFQDATSAVYGGSLPLIELVPGQFMRPHGSQPWSPFDPLGQKSVKRAETKIHQWTLGQGLTLLMDQKKVWGPAYLPWKWHIWVKGWWIHGTCRRKGWIKRRKHWVHWRKWWVHDE